jgi:hypothetical protein
VYVLEFDHQKASRPVVAWGAAALLSLALVAPAFAAPTVIDFEELAALGIPSFTKFGVTFTSGGPPGSVSLLIGANASGNLIGNYVEDPAFPDDGVFDLVRADFTGVMGQVSVDLGDYPSAFDGENDAETLFLYAFDAADALIASATLNIDQYQVAYNTLSVAGPGIKYVQFGSFGGLGGSSAYADNFKFDTAVPEPSTWAMLILGFSSLGALLRRRRAIAA